MPQLITVLMARIKLQKRHSVEFDRLAANQLLVLKLIREETAQKLIDCCEDKRACIDLTRQQSARRVDLMARHQEERARMQGRHRREAALLEESLGRPQ